MHRQLFEVNTDTGTWGDTGPCVEGAVWQMHWNPTTADTGGDLQVAILPKQADTGDGFVIYDDNDCLGSNFVRAPRQGTHDISGDVDAIDTGTPASLVPYVMSGDRIRVKVTPGGAAVAGRLYVWVV